MIDIGENIRRIRELKNLTQDGVSGLLGVSQKTYSNIEKSGDNITYEKIEKIAGILEVSVTQILELNVSHLLNNVSQQGGLSQLNLAVRNGYFHDEQTKMYERLLAEKDRVIELLSSKISL